MLKIKQFNRLLFGFDFFISYSRIDGTLYASELANQLIEKGFTCLIDHWGTEPGKELPKSLKSSISKSTIMIILASKGANSSIAITEEIDIFLKTKRPIIPIDFGEIKDSIWYSKIDGISIYTENTKNLIDAKLEKKIIQRLSNSFKYTKQKTRVSNSAIVALLLIIAAGIMIGWFSIKVKALDTEIVEKQNKLTETVKLVEITEKKADDYLQSAELREKKSFELLDYIEGDIQGLYPQPSIEAFIENKKESKLIEPIFSLYFKNDKSNITPKAQKILDGIIIELRNNPNIKVKITGFTSEYSWITENTETSLKSSGLEKRTTIYSKRVSKTYAKSIFDSFVRNGIDPGRFESNGLGIDKKYSLDYMNNRVEISIEGDKK